MIALWMANCRVGITQLSATLLDRRCPLRVLADMTANLGDVRFALLAQPVDATPELNPCWGSEFRRFGRSLSRRAILFK